MADKLKYKCAANECQYTNLDQPLVSFVKLPNGKNCSDPDEKELRNKIRRKYLNILWAKRYSQKNPQFLENDITAHLGTEYYICSDHVRPEAVKVTGRGTQFHLNLDHEPYSLAHAEAVRATRKRELEDAKETERSKRHCSRRQSDASKDATIQELQRENQRLEDENTRLLKENESLNVALKSLQESVPQFLARIKELENINADQTRVIAEQQAYVDALEAKVCYLCFNVFIF